MIFGIIAFRGEGDKFSHEYESKEKETLIVVCCH